MRNNVQNNHAINKTKIDSLKTDVLTKASSRQGIGKH